MTDRTAESPLDFTIVVKRSRLGCETEYNYLVHPYVLKDISQNFARQFPSRDFYQFLQSHQDAPVFCLPMTLSDDLLQSLDLGGEVDDIQLFIDAALNRPVHFSVMQSFRILRIADEWECPEIQTRMVDFLSSVASPAHVVSFAIRAPHSSSVVRLAALRFADVWAIPNFLTLSPATICEIVTSPECVRPPPDIFAKFVPQAVVRHKGKCRTLIGLLDLLTDDLESLETIERERVFPSFARIIKLRQIEREFDHLKAEKQEREKLHSKIKQLRQENAEAKEMLGMIRVRPSSN
jgi:hypothetical protein